MELEDYRRTSFEAWEAMAPGWERRRAQLAQALTPVREWLIAELEPSPGDTVLELSAGPGDTGFAAAAIVGERGRLISTDFSPDMVEVARRRGAELGLQNVDYRVLDAERIELDTDSVDGVLCQRGYMLMAAPATALAETRRVLRPAGRLALSVWGAPEHNPWAAIGGRALVERGHMRPPEPGAPGLRGSSAWQVRNARGRSSRARASRRCAQRTYRCASPFETLTTTSGGSGRSLAHSRWWSVSCPSRSARRSKQSLRRRSASSQPAAASNCPASLSAQ